MKNWFNAPAIKKCQDGLCNWMALWYFLFPIAVYLNPSKGGTSNIFYLGILFPWVALFVMGRVNLWYKNSVYIVAIILFFYLWLNSLWGGNNSLVDTLHLFKWFVYALCLLTAPILITERFPLFFERLLPFIFGAAVVGAALNIYFHIDASGTNFPHSRMVGWGHGFNPIGLGLHHGIAVLIGIFLVDQYKAKVFWIGVACILPLSVMMLSQSRGPMIALILCSLMVLFLVERSKALLLTKVALLGVVVTAVIFIGWDHILGRGFSGRPEIWGQVWELIKQSMVWGEGYSVHASRVFFRGYEMTHSHNVILELLRYGGLVAVLLFILQMVTLFRFQFKSGDKISGYYIIILSFNTIVMLTSGWYLLDRPNYFWLGYWYPIGLLMVKQHLLATHNNLTPAH